MKKILVLLAILFIGILLAGCTSQPATPVATPAPTMAPTPVATAVPPTPVPTVQASVTANVTPTAAPTPVPTATPAPQFTITFNSDLTVTHGGPVYIKAGTQVSFVNNDMFKPHGVQALSPQTMAYFGTVSIKYGKPLTVTFSKPGSYDYQTIFQPSVIGKIIVTS
jgi:plastocyanin